ncbi:MAG: hypothetical protein ACRC2H_05610 [Silanimonas sp.]
MPIHLFRSTDPGAPALNGNPGTLIAVLDACLLSGYNAKTVTITRSGSTATATATAHGFVLDQQIRIVGAAQAEYNGTFRITNITANTFDFTVTGTPVTPATGAITADVAPLGWTKPFSGTNIAAYRGPVGSARHFLRVDDTNGQFAAVRGFEAMTDINTGTGQFPTTVQAAGGLFWNKSSAAGTAVRRWTLVSDGRTIYLLIYQTADDPTSTNISNHIFGDIRSYRPGDVFNTLLTGSGNSTTSSTITASSGFPGNCFSDSPYNISTTMRYGRFMPRDHFQEGSAIQPVFIAPPGHAVTTSTNNSNTFGNGLVPFPNPANGALFASRILLSTPSVVRGELPGVFAPFHTRPYDDAFAFDGTGDFAGLRLYHQFLNSGSTFGCLLFNLTDNWYA